MKRLVLLTVSPMDADGADAAEMEGPTADVAIRIGRAAAGR